MIINFRSLGLYWREHVILWLSISTILLVFIGAALVVLRVIGFPELLVLHVNAYNGIDWLGPWYRLIISYFILLLMVIGNFIWSYYVYTRDKYMSYYLNVASLFVVIFFIIYVFLTASYS